MNDKIKTAVIYARVSTKDQDNQRQVSELKAFAQRRGFEVIAVLEEKASGAKDDRPVRKQVLEMARGKEMDAILVMEMTRWGRNTEDLLSTMDSLAGYGVSLIARSGDMEMDMTSPSGRMLVTLLAAISEFERGIIRERVKSGIASAKARGKVIGRKSGDHYKSDKKQNKIETMHKEGKSVRAIAKETGLGKSTVADTIKRLKLSAHAA